MREYKTTKKEREQRKKHYDEHKKEESDKQKERYWKNPEKYRKLNRKYRQKRLLRIPDYQKKLNAKNRAYFLRNKIILVNIMGSECCKCGYHKNLSALETHHLNPKDKEDNCNKLTKKRLKERIALFTEGKVILVCSNCHKEIHYPNYQTFSLE